MQPPLVTYRMTQGSTVQAAFPGQPTYFSRDAELAYLGDFAGRPIQVQAGAFVRFRFDLSKYLTAQQKIFYAVGVLDEENGVDVTPGARFLNPASVEGGGKAVRQDFNNLVPGALYVLTISVLLGAPQLQKRFKVPFYTTGENPMSIREVDTQLPITGGPITDTGTIGLVIPLTLQYGGTGGTTANAALDNLSGASGTTAGTLSRAATGAWTVTPGGAGTITGVTAGAGLSGGGTSGIVTISCAQPYLPISGGTLANLTVTGTTTLNGSTATTPGTTDNSTNIATTAYVKAQGYGTGTITGVTAGTGLNGGGSSGAVTLALSSPVAIANGGTNAVTAGAGADNLNGFSGTTAGLVRRTGAATYALDSSAYLTGNQTVTLSGDVTGSGTTAIPTTLVNSGVTAGTYNNVTVNAKGLVTLGSNSAYLLANQTITISGDATGSGATAIALTLATVNSNIGTWNNVTVNGKGLVTAGSNVAYLTGNQTITLTGNVTGSGTTAITTTIPASTVTNAMHANMNANTLKGNNTAGAAAPADLTVAQVSTLLGLGPLATQAIPATVPQGGTGATTLASGQVLQGNGTAAISAVANGQLPATATNDNATAGHVGEVVSSIISTAQALPATGTGGNFTSISVTAGDWDVYGNIQCTFSSTASYMELGISTVSTGIPAGQFACTTGPNGGAGFGLGAVAPTQRFSLSATTTLYLVIVASYASTATAVGQLWARRAR